MGDPEGGPQPSGLLPEQVTAYAVSFAKSRSIDNARWNKAEQRTAELIKQIKGTQASEERRKDVADYVGNLIRKCFDCQVCTFGSVPLKTYLPDGDIDLTIVSRDPRRKDTWANDVRSMLERAERNQDGKFCVKGVQYINAEVKLIKCHVENIVVDISFNQLGGLCTLCFLEEVDRVIGKDHFFKRSIILVKAWCYYESTILGAHHGLISTYALETLVLYIFHVFHSSLRGPLEVLLRFLEFFSKFDWHKYAVSVWGPVPLSSLPEMIAEPPRKDGGELLLSKAFLDVCLEEYAVFLAGQDSQGRIFTAKYLNIVDPLRAGNNLGRSVNQTNFNRIVKVLGHSADKLLKILQDPSKDIDECFDDKRTGFFKRTKDRLGQFEEKRPDAAGGIPQSKSTLPASSNQRNHQNGPVEQNVQEINDDVRSCGGETYYADHYFPNKAEGWILDVESTAQANGYETLGPASSSSRIDSNILHQVSVAPVFDNGVKIVPSINGSSSSASQSSHLPIQGRSKGSFSSSEAVEKPSGLNPRISMDIRNGSIDRNAKISRVAKEPRYPVSNGMQKDPEAIMDVLLAGASVMTCRNSYTQTNFEKNALSGSSDSASSESSRGSANLTTEGTSEVPLPVRRSSPNRSTEKEAYNPGGWAGEQQSFVDANGGLDGQAYGQQRGQDPLSRGPSSLITPHNQMPLTLSHPSPLPMHLATSVSSSSKGHLSMGLAGPAPVLGLHSVHTPSIMTESPLGLGPRAGPYYAMQRGPPAPPLPPGYFHGPPLTHQLPTMGEIPNAVARLSSYPLQQGEDKTYEHQQREVWQKMDQMQVREHQQKYGYLRQPASSISAAVSPLHQHLNSDNTFLISSAPAVVTSSSFHIPGSLVVPRNQPARAADSGKVVSHNGSSSNLESVNIMAAGQGAADDFQLDENGNSWLDNGEMGSLTLSKGKLPAQLGSESIVRGSKNSKPSREKKVSNKMKTASNEDVADIGLADKGVPSSSAESPGCGPAQGVDDTFIVLQGYQQLLPTTGPALCPVVYPHVLSSSFPLHGNGITVSEVSPYHACVVPPTRSPGHSALTSSALNQSSSIGIPSAPSTSPRSPDCGVVEHVNGLNGPINTQRQRPTESTPLPPSVYYPAGNHLPFLSMYSPAYPIYMLPQSPDPTYIGLDLLHGLHLSGSFESYNDTSGPQAEDLRLRFIQQGRPGVGERLRAAGIATSALSRSEATVDTRASDFVDVKYFSGDLLSSDFSNHLRNLDYARWCQSARMPVPMYVQPPFLTPSTKYYPDYRSWEGPGRPLGPNMSMISNVMSHGHGLVPGPPSMNTSARMVGSFSRTYTGPVSYGGDELPKSHGGTGPFLPNPRPPYIRERQSSGSGRNQHGGYNQDQVHGAKYRGSGRGQSKYEPRSQSNGVERNNFDGKGGERARDRDVHRQHDGHRRNPGHLGSGTNFSSPSAGVPPVSVCPPASAGMSVETDTMPVVTSIGKSSALGAAGGTIPAVTVGPTEKRVGLVPEPLEFGSLGPVQVGAQAGSDGHRGAVHISGMRAHEQVITHSQRGSAGSCLTSVEGSSQGPSSPNQRVMQRAYQLKEEDFPPLSFRGQHGSSSSGVNSGSSAGSQTSYPACVVMPSW